MQKETVADVSAMDTWLDNLRRYVLALKHIEDWDAVKADLLQRIANIESTHQSELASFISEYEYLKQEIEDLENQLFIWKECGGPAE